MRPTQYKKTLEVNYEYVDSIESEIALEEVFDLIMTKVIQKKRTTLPTGPLAKEIPNIPEDESSLTNDYNS